MGINPTPTNHRSFTYDGKSTREFGVYITGKDVFNAPERAVEMISIPGRDGEYALDQGHFNNIEVTYRAGIVADSTTDFAEAISNFRNWLASREGYCRLTDEYNTEEYRMAVFKNAIALEHEGLLTGEFDVTFDCKPQRYLAIGEELTEIGAWGNTETAEGEVVTIDASSDTAVKALTADIDPIQDLHGYDAPWGGGAGHNKWDEVWEAGGINVNGTNNNESRIRSKNYIPVTPSTTYYVWTDSSASYDATIMVLAFDSNKTVLSNLGWKGGSVPTFTTPSDCYYIRFQGTLTRGTTLGSNIAINYPSTVTTYAPYENICPISGHDEVSVSVNGVNQWNETYTSNKMVSSSNGTIASRGSSENLFGATDYVPVVPNTEYYFKIKGLASGSYGCAWYDANKTFISGNAFSGYTTNDVGVLTSPNNARFLRTTINMPDDESTSINYPSTDHDYHAYNGQSYTTTLPSTTYGGTLDIVSGTLKPAPYYASYNGEALEGEWVSDRDKYVAGTTPTTGAQVVNIGKVGTATQLTGQSIELLEGENNIFANSGNVTVEYGHNPTLLTNPTWFPSKPLLYAEGYGDINLGSRTITVSDEPIGEVLLANKIERKTSNRSYFDTATLALLNVGDTITVSSGSQLIVGISSSSTSTTITSITATVTGGTAQVIGAPSTYIDRYGDGRIEITMDAFDFANGTTENATVELDVTVNYKENGTTKSWSSTEFVAGYRYSVVSNAVSFAGFEVEPSLPDDIYSYIPRDATIENIYGYSTKQITADGYYIDLDIGEAYTMVDGVPSSINNLVTMPSDLPTLPPGDTEVTYDNTITKVEVKPNYWKV